MLGKSTVFFFFFFIKKLHKYEDYLPLANDLHS